jgi:hypothetical protein
VCARPFPPRVGSEQCNADGSAPALSPAAHHQGQVKAATVASSPQTHDFLKRFSPLSATLAHPLCSLLYRETRGEPSVPVRLGRLHVTAAEDRENGNDTPTLLFPCGPSATASNGTAPLGRGGQRPGHPRTPPMLHPKRTPSARSPKGRPAVGFLLASPWVTNPRLLSPPAPARREPIRGGT